MFENLIESGRKTDLKSTITNSTASIIFHAVMIMFAVYATLNAGNVVQERV